MKTALKIVLPLVVLAIGIAASSVLGGLREAPVREEPAVQPPLVETLPVRRAPYRLRVPSQGTVDAARRSELVAEVSGRVDWVSPALSRGGFFEAEEVLATIEPADFEVALVQARAELARAELRLAEERAEAQVARDEWREVGGGDPSELTLRTPYVREAEGALAAARAAVELAELNLARTKIRAPFQGRVSEKLVELGEFVSRGARLAEVYSIGAAEVRLPLHDRDLAHVELPLGLRSEGDGPRPEVFLWASFGGVERRWRGRIVRTEGELDRRTRALYAVARVEDPYGLSASLQGPPLTVGTFVRAEILGRELAEAVVLPRAALRGGDCVWTAQDGRLRVTPVDVVRAGRDEVVITGGLQDGDRVVTSRLEVAVDGMRVREAAAGDG